MSLAASILAAFAPTLTPVRRGSLASPAFVDGRPVAGPVATVQILAKILPKGASRLVRETEGERRGGRIEILSADPVYAGRDTGEPADLIDWNGATYEVDGVDLFEDGGLYVATATRRPLR